MSWILTEDYEFEYLSAQQEVLTPDILSYDYEHRNLSDWYLNAADEITNDILGLPISWEQPYPMGIWYMTENGPLCSGLPEPLIGGSFRYSTIEYVSIPESVKYIGEYAFAYTNLAKVRIASDCVYSSTSFPEGCEILFYD